jgi:hypothetical protein
MEFVYGRLSILHKHGVGIGAATVGLVVIFVGMVALSVLRTRMKGRGAEVRGSVNCVARALLPAKSNHEHS